MVQWWSSPHASFFYHPLVLMDQVVPQESVEGQLEVEAAFEPGEVRAQLEATGLSGLVVEPIADRYLVVVGRLLEPEGGRAP